MATVGHRNELLEPSLGELRAVHAGSRELVRETPTMTLRSLSREIGGEIVLKAENLQRTGSFQLRGALAKLRTIDRDSCRGVVAGSAGNHAQSLAYAARSAGLACRVYMPAAASIPKVDAVEAFGGEVVREGGAVEDCLGSAREAAAEEGWRAASRSRSSCTRPRLRSSACRRAAARRWWTRSARARRSN